MRRITASFPTAPLARGSSRITTASSGRGLLRTALDHAATNRPAVLLSSAPHRGLQLSAWRRPQWSTNLRQARRRAEENPAPAGSGSNAPNGQSSGTPASSNPAGATAAAPKNPAAAEAEAAAAAAQAPKKAPVAPITWKSALLALGACGLVLAYFEIEKAKRKPKIEIAVVGTPSIGGPFTLVDQDGRVVTNHTFQGRYMLLYFGFTFCPDICPAELAKVTKAINILEEEQGITPGLVVPVFISVDPYRDTVAKIRTYLKDFHPSFVGLTGTPQQVESMARAFRVYSSTSQHSEEDEDYLVDHSIFLYLMDKEGNFLSHHGSQYDAQALAERIAHDVRSKGDCPPSLWVQLKEKANSMLGSLIH